MKWYTAKCLFRSEIAGKQKRKQLMERRYFLVRAKDDSSAFRKAKVLGIKKQLRGQGTVLSEPVRRYRSLL
jgi:hypothetical protein